MHLSHWGGIYSTYIFTVNPSIPDTLGPEGTVMKVSSFQGLKMNYGKVQGIITFGWSDTHICGHIREVSATQGSGVE